MQTAAACNVISPPPPTPPNINKESWTCFLVLDNVGKHLKADKRWMLLTDQLSDPRVLVFRGAPILIFSQAYALMHLPKTGDWKLCLSHRNLHSVMYQLALLSKINNGGLFSDYWKPMSVFIAEKQRTFFINFPRVGNSKSTDFSSKKLIFEVSWKRKGCALVKYNC